ncbi:MAG: T9SS type A sorting domain-containing protein [Candidatus Latescibacteria bacterium]|nr:T9SS type A sorting domain-containing protein [Candidatus Latescibacterota bacterium]
MKKYIVLLVLPVIVLAVSDIDSITINRWRCNVYNDGRWGSSTLGGAYWPNPLRNFYIYGAGIWIGGISSDTFVTVGYNPNTGLSEMIPTLNQYWRQGYGNTLDRIYKYPGDWPAPLSRFPMAPQIARSNMDLWCCFGDSDPSRHTPPGLPLGVDVALTVYGFSDSIAQDFFFLKYDLMNNNNYLLNNLYFGVILDGDIGIYTDDMVGLIRDRYFTIGTQTIRVKNTGFMYDFDNNEPPGQYWQSGTPGAVAIRFISATGGLTMSAFKKFTLDFDPMTDKHQYKTLAGYNYQTGAYEPYDSIDLVPGDKRFLMSSGPFNLSSMSSASFHYAVIAAPYGEAGATPTNRDTTQLAWQSYLADSIYHARILGIEEENRKPHYLTTRIFPNPFKSYLNISTIINEKISADIYNVNGVLIKSLSGTSHLLWNGKDNKDAVLPNGVYFIKVSIKGQTSIHKVLLIRN